MFRKMPFILVAIILAIVFLDPIIPFELKQFLYTISLNIKSLIILLLPFIIFGLLFKAAVMLSSSATKIIGMILILVCCSNFISTFLSHYLGTWIYGFNLSTLKPYKLDGLTNLWLIDFPRLISNDKAMFAGIIIGVLSALIIPAKSKFIATKIETYINKLLAIFVYLIPLFVAGFIVKLQYDGVVTIIIKDYTAVFALIALAQFSYIALAYLC
jgi:hypothetical protein